MNPHTGHLATVEELSTHFGEGRTLSPDELRERGYEPVPPGRMSRRAEKLLNGGSGVVVPQNDPLTRAMRKVRAIRHNVCESVTAT